MPLLTELVSNKDGFGYRHGAPNGACAPADYAPDFWQDARALTPSVRIELFFIHRPKDVAFVMRHFVLLEKR